MGNFNVWSINYHNLILICWLPGSKLSYIVIIQYVRKSKKYIYTIIYYYICLCMCIFYMICKISYK